MKYEYDTAHVIHDIDTRGIPRPDPAMNSTPRSFQVLENTPAASQDSRVRNSPPTNFWRFSIHSNVTFFVLP